jgi:hypothetical protein
LGYGWGYTVMGWTLLLIWISLRHYPTKGLGWDSVPKRGVFTCLYKTADSDGSLVRDKHVYIYTQNKSHNRN